MNRTITILAAGIALGGPVQAGHLAGAGDGRHQAANGDLVDTAAPMDRTDAEGWNCIYPVLRGGRIVPRSCRGNGNRDADLETGSRVGGGVGTYEGIRHVRPASLSRPVRPGAPPTAAADPLSLPRTHGGSVVMVDPDRGVVTYLGPDASPGAAVREGAAPLRGTVDADEPMDGVSRLHEAGCPASSPSVDGTYAGLDTLTFRGVDSTDCSPDALSCLSHPLDDGGPDHRVAGMAAVSGTRRQAGMPTDAAMAEEAATTARQGVLQLRR